MFNQGLAQFKADQYTAAIETFKKASAIRANVPESHFNLGLSYYRLKRYNDSAAYRKAVRLKPDYASAYI